LNIEPTRMARPQTFGMSTHDRRPKGAVCLAGSLLLILMGGCAPLELSKGISLSLWQPKPQTPETMADFWTEYLHRQGGQRTVRGFGGRVMFYGRTAGEPIVVDGTLTVYAFDDSKGEPNEQAADKKYVFTREQLAKHYSKSELGHSYSFWLPWDEVGGDEKKITLITRFDDVGGKVVMSKPAKQTLFGVQPALEKPTGQQASKGASDSKVRPVSFEESSGRSPRAPTDVQAAPSSTIDLPPSFVRRMRAAIDAAAESQPSPTAAGGSSRSPTTTAPAEAEKVVPAGAAKDDRMATGMTSDAAASGDRATPPEARSAPSRFPVRRERTARPAFDHVRTTPYPATWPSSLPRSPHTDQPTESTATTPGEPAG